MCCCFLQGVTLHQSARHHDNRRGLLDCTEGKGGGGGGGVSQLAQQHENKLVMCVVADF